MERSLKIAGALILTALLSVRQTAPTPGRAAAVALRDAVPRYQQLGTEYFTVPRLEESYAHHWYLTATPDHSQHAEFVAALKQATAEYPEVDVFLLAQGNSYIRWVRELDPASRAKIRLVYDTGGGSADRGPEWISLGVGAFVGHPGGNVAPLFYVKFLPRWLAGETLDDAVAESNAETHAELVSTSGRAVARVTQWATGMTVDTSALWLGTEAKIFRK